MNLHQLTTTEVLHSLKSQAGAAREVVADIAVGLTTGGKEFVDIGRTDVAGARSPQPEIGIELPDHTGFPRIGIAAGGVIGVTPREAGRDFLGHRQILDNGNLRFDEFLHDGVVAREGLVVRQAVAVGDRESIGRGRGLEAAPLGTRRD